MGDGAGNKVGTKPSSGLPVLKFLLSGFMFKILPSRCPREKKIHDGDESVDKMNNSFRIFYLQFGKVKLDFQQQQQKPKQTHSSLFRFSDMRENPKRVNERDRTLAAHVVSQARSYVL